MATSGTADYYFGFFSADFRLTFSSLCCFGGDESMRFSTSSNCGAAGSFADFFMSAP